MPIESGFYAISNSSFRKFIYHLSSRINATRNQAALSAQSTLTNHANSEADFLSRISD